MVPFAIKSVFYAHNNAFCIHNHELWLMARAKFHTNNFKVSKDKVYGSIMSSHIGIGFMCMTSIGTDLYKV